METKANSTLIGAFTLVVLALGFVFVYWMARGEVGSDAGRLTVTFNGPVTGLTPGSPVFFNGIRVGAVDRLRIDPSDPRRVIGDLSVDAATPIKPDTSVMLGFQGLTGLGYVELAGGSPEAENLLKRKDGAALNAEASAMQDLMASARTMMARADKTLATLDRLVSENSESISRSIHNVETFTGALSANSEDIGTLVKSASRAADSIANLSGRLEGVAVRADQIVSAVEPGTVRSTIEDASTFVASLAAQSAEIDGIVSRVATITEDVSAVTGRLATFSEKAEALFGQVGDKANRLLDAVDPERVGRTLASMERAAGSIDRIAAAVPPEAVQASVQNFAVFSQTLKGIGERREDIDGFITRLSAVAADANAFSARLPAIGERAETILAAVTPEAVQQTLASVQRAAGSLEGAAGDVRRIAAAVPPEAVQGVVQNVSAFAQTLGGVAARREEIDQLLTRISAIAGDVNAFSARLPTIGEKADALVTNIGARTDALLAALDPEALNQTLASLQRASATVEAAAGDVRQVTSAIPPEAVQGAVQNFSAFSEVLGGLAARQEEIDAALTRVTSITADVNAFTARLPGIGERVEGVVTGIGDTADRLREAIDPEAIGRAVGAVERAAANVEQVTASVPAEAVRATAENLAAFSGVLAARSPDVDALVTRLSAISADVAAFSPRLPAIGDKVDGLLAAVDAQKIGESVDGVHRFTTALGNSSENVEAVMADARDIAAQLKGVTAKADSLLAELDGMAGDEGGGIIAEARATLASIRQTAETFDQQAQVIGNGVNQFSTRGLRDLQDFVSEGRRTVARLDRVISSMERDPSQILFGGEGVPEYKGSRSGGAQRR